MSALLRQFFAGKTKPKNPPKPTPVPNVPVPPSGKNPRSPTPVPNVPDYRPTMLGRTTR